MANYITNTEDLTSVANAIRSKAGTTESLEYPTGFVSAISGISGGGWAEKWKSTVGQSGNPVYPGFISTGYINPENNVSIAPTVNSYNNDLQFSEYNIKKLVDYSSWELGVILKFDSFRSDRSTTIFGSTYMYYPWPNLEIYESGRCLWGGMATSQNSWTTNFRFVPEEGEPNLFGLNIKYFFKMGWDGSNAYVRVYNVDTSAIVCQEEQPHSTNPHTYYHNGSSLHIGRTAMDTRWRPSLIDLSNLYLKANGNIILGCKTTTIGD